MLIEPTRGREGVGWGIEFARERESPFCYSCEKGRFNRPNRRVLIQIKIDPLIWDFYYYLSFYFIDQFLYVFSFLLLYEGSNLSLPLLLLLLLLLF
jgi:hypothetical protein